MRVLRHNLFYMLSCIVAESQMHAVSRLLLLRFRQLGLRQLQPHGFGMHRLEQSAHERL